MPQQPTASFFREFLESADARPIRLLSEYLEPLSRFRDEKIQDAVVFLGRRAPTAASGRSARFKPCWRAEYAAPTITISPN